MQEIKKRRIVIASVLKPVDDPRMFEKLGLTLAIDHAVHIIGSHGSTRSDHPGLHLHPIGTFSRLSFARWRKRSEIFALIRNLEPDLIIICTHELLWHAAWIRLRRKVRVWYDVQEDYAKNIVHTNAFPFMFRRLIAGMVRLKERICAPLIERFLLAEKVYQSDLSFVQNRSLLLENKVRKKTVIERKHIGHRRLIFTGTLNENTGVFEAIKLASALHNVDEKIHLTIAGFCPKATEYQRIKNHLKGKSFVTLIGGNKLVPHSEILDLISISDFGIISYPDNDVTREKMPTKLYEYIGSKLPFILVNNPTWTKFASHFDAAIIFDPASFDPTEILAQMDSKNFYTTLPFGVFWDDYESSLLKLI